MKNIFKLIIGTVILFSISFCISCKEEKTSNDRQESTTAIETIPQEIKDRIVAQDSLMKELVNKVDTLTEALNTIKTENVVLKGKLESLKNPRDTWAWPSVGALILSIVALLLAIFRRGLNEHEVNAVVSDRFDDSKRMKDFTFHINKLYDEIRKFSKKAPENPPVSSDIEGRLQKIEKTLKESSSLPSPTLTQRFSASQNTTRQPEPESLRIGYAKIDTAEYFTTIYDSNQEGCVFRITFINQAKGRFNIISLDKIQSSNDWQKKVECSGISIKNASDFHVEEEGVCEKIDENTWKVMKPLRIKLK